MDTKPSWVKAVLGSSGCAWECFQGLHWALTLVILLRFMCWSRAVCQGFVCQRDGLGRKITLISCTGLKKPPCTFQKSARGDLISRQLLLLPAEVPFSGAGRLGPRRCSCTAHSGRYQSTSLVLRGEWGYSSEERHFDGICVVTII